MRGNRSFGIELKPNRLESLSDGVLAIAMTLLVIELSVPVLLKTNAEEELKIKLFEMWPKFAAYALSFLILGIFWFFHHFLFHYIKRSDGRFVWLNILFLLFVALIPFSTALIGEYSIFAKSAVIFYGANGFIIMLMLNMMWWYATKNKRLVDKDIRESDVKNVQIRFLLSAIMALLAIGLSFINPYFGIAIYIIIVLWAIIEILATIPYYKKNIKT
ncbi:MAG: DUF1211 domain-containing protein [Actinobacteria bacterium]|nr:DUF1211 domain-containing protein [Actinomycetota bacterium]